MFYTSLLFQDSYEKWQQNTWDPSRTESHFDLKKFSILYLFGKEMYITICWLLKGRRRHNGHIDF